LEEREEVLAVTKEEENIIIIECVILVINTKKILTSFSVCCVLKQMKNFRWLHKKS
tara:strand:- start:349 stop:516 length:168 start_codon:yes stop_codon:yes gene_type:complete